MPVSMKSHPFLNCLQFAHLQIEGNLVILHFIFSYFPVDSGSIIFPANPLAKPAIGWFAIVVQVP